MASVSASVNNGEIVTSASQASLASANTRESSSMDKDAFLQLLVAQMKYQDPLEPTSNTEYIAQYAQFSQVEALNNMSQTMELSRYSSYVGKEVVIGSEEGEESQIRGMVDYVTFEGGKAYLSIDGNLYAASDLVSVIGNEYSDAESIAKAFAKEIKDLPNLDSVSIANNGNTISGLLSMYNSLSDYQKGFLDDDDVDSMNKYVEKLNELLIAAAQEAEKQAEEAGNTQNSQADVTVSEADPETAAEEGLVNPDDDEENGN